MVLSFRLSGTRWFLALALAIAAIMLASLVLGYYSYQATSRVAARSDETLERSNRAEGQKLIERIERVIIDSDRTLFRMVRLEDPEEFRQLWRRIVRIDPVVKTVIVLDEQLKVVHLVSRSSKVEPSRFRETFLRHIVPSMKLPSLPRNAHRHLHRDFDGTLYLISYIRRHSAGQDYYIALSINLPYVTKEIFKEEFQGLEESKFIAVVDDQGGLIYGQKPPDAGQFMFQDRFPTTLYRWRLQVAPRAVVALRDEARTRRTSNIVLVGLAGALLIIGLLTLLFAVRQEHRANQLKSLFISNVTHELKTPLSLIHMFGELLAMGRSSDAATAKEYAEIITRESDRLSRLIDNVLDFSRIERGKAAYDFAPGQLRRVVERGVDLVRYRAEQAGIQLKTVLAQELPPVMMDDSAMTLLMVNLLENALKYGCTEQGGEIQVSLEQPDETCQVLRVADHGPGMPLSEQRRIFDRFYRGTWARRAGTRGSGIGLSLVKHIAEAHGGKVQVESAEGQGATFSVRIPV